MSKFLSYYNLFPIPDPKEFLGLASDCEKGNVVTTLARNVVVVLNIRTQKQLLSWSLPEKLSAKVIYDRNSQKYVGVFGNHSLRLWNVETLDVTKCKKLKFQKSIAHLVETDQEALVLYSDGVCQTLSAALESRVDQKADTAEQLALTAATVLTKPTVFTLAEGHQVLTYFQEKRETGELHLVRVSLDTSTRKEYLLQRESIRLTGYAVIEDDVAPHLLTIWSDKRIFMLNLGEGSTERAPGQFVSMLSHLNVESNLSVHGVSRNFAAIYGANYGQEGASLLVYNTQFKVVNAKQYFKVYLEFSRLWSRDEHILLAMGQNIAAVRYRMNRELLVDMLGSQFDDTHMNQITIELDHINEEECLEATIRFDNSSKPHIDEHKLDNVAIEAIAPADKINVPFDPPEVFQQNMNELVKQHVHGEVRRCENSLEDVGLTLMSNFHDDGSFTVTTQALIRQLEKCGAGEQEIAEKLLTLFIKTNNSKQMLMCLKRYCNISESMLAWSLRYALDQNDPKKKLLNAVLATSFEPSAIEEPLRQRLELTHVQHLLEHLYHLVIDPHLQLEERPDRESSVAQTEIHALQWLGALLTSHFTLLTISKDESLLELLTNWSQQLKLYEENIQDIEVLVPLLTNIVERKELKPIYSTNWYGIEEFVLY
ncbi:uncharacterized protein Dwil_GK20236 [Drosophila willistoni]|uniref:Uncharacterized protein n=1 Tax=Drosophila willistoni TaxID=7260 RepID=B4MXL5_DROWI|nr:nucleolar protein 11 [Drosophila willistoni]EDW76784.1 uncharacterized protein Dwil_GK20236 [Drosophila willistoni]